MGRVKLVCSADGKDVSEKIKSSLQSVTDAIDVMAVDDLIGTDYLDKRDLGVIVLTPMAWSQLKHIGSNHLNRWLKTPERIIVVYLDTNLVQIANKWFTRNLNGWNATTFSARDRRDWLYAEAEMKFLLEEAKHCVSKFEFKPERYSDLVSNFNILYVFTVNSIRPHVVFYLCNLLSFV